MDHNIASKVQDLERYLGRLEAVEQDSMKHYREIYPYTGCAMPRVTCEMISAGAGMHLLRRIPIIVITSQNEKITKLVQALSDRWKPLFGDDDYL